MAANYEIKVLAKWADPDLSYTLPMIRNTGEGPAVEFKEQFPEQAHRLAEELAALGTSGGGKVFIGINDNCDLIGVDASDGQKRDKLVERAQGIISTVRPQLKADILFAVEDEKVAIVIVIPKQDEPVFYYDFWPYIREGRRSRPANPDEVKKLIWSHPSAEHARRMEDLTYKMAVDHNDNMQRIRPQ
jgi:predicted HTH transcriptional regulator